MSTYASESSPLLAVEVLGFVTLWAGMIAGAALYVAGVIAW